MTGLVWRSAFGTVVNASLARRSRFPTLSRLCSTESGDTGLASEATANATASVSPLLGASVRVETGAVFCDLRDRITRNGSSTSTTNLYRNFGTVRRARFETVLDVTSRPGLTLRADDTFVDAKDRDAVRVADDATNVPRHKAGILASWASATF
ncbi:MAG: hypothetical protein ACYDBY_20665 [Thermoanaerobaculia bacterium]